MLLINGKTKQNSLKYFTGVIDNDQMTMIPLQIASDFRSCLLKIGTLIIDNLKANCKVFHQLSSINTLD